MAERSVIEDGVAAHANFGTSKAVERYLETVLSTA